MKIDAHQHFWQFDPVRDSWITDDMQVIQQDFLPGDLQPLLLENNFDGCVAVQASQSELETEFLVQLAAQHSFIKGVVGWVDLQAEAIADRLDYFSGQPVIKGFRHVLQGEPQRDLMLTPAFRRGIAALAKHGFTYDILIFPDQVNFATQLAADFPNQRFVVDHIAKPYIKKGEILPWKKDMEQLASLPNVYCKLSGMVTEADWRNWQAPDLRPYIDAVVNAFGVERLMFGSDWPVCLVAASYSGVVKVVADYFETFSETEQQQVFGKNAADFYDL